MLSAVCLRWRKHPITTYSLSTLQYSAVPKARRTLTTTTTNKSTPPIIEIDVNDEEEDLFDKLSYNAVEALIEHLGAVELTFKEPPQPTYVKRTFRDRVIVKTRGGNGGAGCVSFKRQAFRPEVPPDGGDGGAGGSVLFQVDPNLPNLFGILPNISAENGQPGKGKNRSGRKGQDKLVKVPLGTIVREYKEGAEKKGKILVDLNKKGMIYVAARGGKGGKGNQNFATGSNRSPKIAEEGEPGEVKELELELKTIADVGLVGFPNAGKSTILSVLSNAQPKVASYPFTTLNPYVGMINIGPEIQPISMADMPGLIEGAHMNRGLGHQFLMHIERTKVLCYVLDMSADDPLEDYLTLQTELKLYNPNLLKRPSIVVANKMDLERARVNYENFKQLAYSKYGRLIMVPISSLKEINLQDLKDLLRDMVLEVRKREEIELD